MQDRWKVRKLSLLFGEVELMETREVDSEGNISFKVASLRRSGINGNFRFFSFVRRNYFLRSLLFGEVELMETGRYSGCS